jgi:hypothetical protein
VLLAAITAAGGAFIVNVTFSPEGLWALMHALFQSTRNTELSVFDQRKSNASKKA